MKFKFKFKFKFKLTWKRVVVGVSCLVAMVVLVSLVYSHCKYSTRASAARALPEGVQAKPGRIFFVSFPENKLTLSVMGWYPTVGHAALVTRDKTGLTKQYDYGWFVGSNGRVPPDAIGHCDVPQSYGVVTRKMFLSDESTLATNDLEIAKMVLGHMFGYGNTIEMWAKDVDDIGIAERYMENLAWEKDRGSMAWRCWQIGGYRCGNITRQAFDAARGEGHFLDLLWGGFPGADAPSIGTEKTVYQRILAP